MSSDKSTACPVCGRDNWSGSSFRQRRQNLAIHMAGHVKKGEAKWVGEKIKGQYRTIEPINTAEPVLPTVKGKIPTGMNVGDKFGKLTVAESGVLMDDKGRKQQFYHGEPCVVCGKNDFITLQQFISHQNWHHRKGEAHWVKDGKNKKLVLGKGKDLAKRSKVEEEDIPLTINNTEHVCDATQLLKDVQSGLTFLNLALALQRLNPTQANQLIATISALGNANLDVKKLR